MVGVGRHNATKASQIICSKGWMYRENIHGKTLRNCHVTTSGTTKNKSVYHLYVISCTSLPTSFEVADFALWPKRFQDPLKRTPDFLFMQESFNSSWNKYWCMQLDNMSVSLLGFLLIPPKVMLWRGGLLANHTLQTGLIRPPTSTCSKNLVQTFQSQPRHHIHCEPLKAPQAALLQMASNCRPEKRCYRKIVANQFLWLIKEAVHNSKWRVQRMTIYHHQKDQKYITSKGKMDRMEAARNGWGHV